MLNISTVVRCSSTAGFPKCSRPFSRSIFLRNSEQNAAESKPLPKSSCPAGTDLNLHVKKTKVGPVALEDSEYPEWLWTVLDENAQKEKLEQDPIKKLKSEMRKRNRAQIKANNFLAEMK